MQQIGVYQIKINNKIYIGSTVKGFKTRYNSHLFHLRKGTHANRHLQSAYDKYGECNLEFSILEIVGDAGYCIEREQAWIDRLNPDYNILKIAGSALGTKRTEESRKKMSDAHIGRCVLEETKIKTSNTMKGMQLRLGHKASEETRKKMSEKHIGNKNGLGYKLSDEHKQKLIESIKGKPMTDEHKQKISEANKGHKRMLGYKYSEEARAKMKEAQIKRRRKEKEEKNWI